jgi:hypothetical protein
LKFFFYFRIDIGNKAITYFLFDGRGSQPQDSGSLTRGTVFILVIEEVRHDQVIIVALISMVAFIKHNHVKFFYLYEPVQQRVVQLFFCEYKNIERVHLVSPVLGLLLSWLGSQ